MPTELASRKVCFEAGYDKCKQDVLKLIDEIRKGMRLIDSEELKSKINGEKPKVIILDDNELSILSYAEEYPENWKKICEAVDKGKQIKGIKNEK